MDHYRPKIEQRILHQLGRVVLLLLIALLQTALGPALWRFRIDWVLVVVVCWTLLRGYAAGVRWAVYGGAALGLLSPLPVGTHLLGLLLAVTAVALLSDPFPGDNRLVPTAMVLIASLLYTGVVALVMAGAGRQVVWARYPFTIMLPEALLNGAFALPAYLLLERFARRARTNVPREA